MLEWELNDIDREKIKRLKEKDLFEDFKKDVTDHSNIKSITNYSFVYGSVDNMFNDDYDDFVFSVNIALNLLNNYVEKI